MTIALCFHCGETKFGALCPCGKCGQGSTGNIQLDITFSDHHFSSRTLEQFGSVIKAINASEPDPTTRFWTFMTYVSEHHGDILHVEPPEDVASRVRELLATLSLPTVTVQKGRSDIATAGPEPDSVIALPPWVCEEYAAVYGFRGMEAVDVRLTDGAVIGRCLLSTTGDQLELAVWGRDGLGPRDVAAIRAHRGWFGWFRKRPWIELPALQETTDQEKPAP